MKIKMEHWKYKDYLGKINDICMSEGIEWAKSERIAKQITKMFNEIIMEEKIIIED